MSEKARQPMSENEDKLQRYRAALAKTKILQEELRNYGYELTEENDGYVIACTSCGFPKDEGHADDCGHALEYSNAECLQRSTLLIEGLEVMNASSDSSIRPNDLMAAKIEWIERCRAANIS